MHQREPHFYQTSVEWQGKRRGVASGPGLPEIVSATPPEFGGEAGYWSPEHFYVIAAETCLMATFIAIAEIARMPVVSYRSSSTGKLEWLDGSGWRFTEIELRPSIEVADESSRARAMQLIEKAERSCLVARSVTAKTVLRPEIRVAEPTAAA